MLPTPMPDRPLPEDVLLEISDLRVDFATDEGLIEAVDGVSLVARRGRTLCIVGESGCGKSVVARSIMRVVDKPGRIAGGQILFQPEPGQITDLAALPPGSRELRAMRGGDIAMIFQEPMTALSPLYSIGNQIMEAIRWHAPTGKREAREMATEALAKVGIPRPERIMDAYSFELSGGMRQRAMIAMALVCKPRLLIADEPTTALDVTTQANILDLIRQLQDEMGMSVIFITHDLGVVAEIADDVAVMYLGRVAEQGSVEDIFHRPGHPYTRALLKSVPEYSVVPKDRLPAIRGLVPHPLNRPSGCAFHDRCDFATASCRLIQPALIGLSETHSAACHHYGDLPDRPDIESVPDTTAEPRPRERQEVGEQVLLEVSELAVHFPITKGFFAREVANIRAVDGVSFAVHEGETLALVGESGCGKTTLGQAIMRLNTPTSGEITFFEQEEAGRSVSLAKLDQKALLPYRQRIRMIFQDPNASLNPRMSVFDIIAECLRMSGRAKGEDLRRRVGDLLERVGLRREYLDRFPHAFSGGQRQRIGIARALAPHPSLIVADEAVSALDVSVQAQILNLLSDMQREFGLTYIFISHDLGVVSHISDRVAVMYVGRIVELAPTADIFARPLHPYTEALLSAVLPPRLDRQAARNRIRLAGEVADAAKTYQGCAFAARCRYRRERCDSERPALRELGNGRHTACHFAEELELRGLEAPQAAQ